MSEGADIVLVLDEPPSANRMYRRSRTTMHKSSDYRAWKDAQAFKIACQLAGARIDGPFAAMVLMPPSRKDLDNRAKPLLDAMQAGGAFKNDNACERLSLEVDRSRETVLVKLWALPAPPKKVRKARPLRMAVLVQPL